MRSFAKIKSSRKFLNLQYFSISDPSSGGSKDYWYNRGIKYSYTIELPPKTAKLGRFMPPASEIYPVAMETIAALKAFAELELGI